MADVVADHRLACAGFTAAVRAVAGRWDVPSPCSEWNADGVVEHVIGFHDVLLLRPLGAKPVRPRGDPVARWVVTEQALAGVLTRPGVPESDRAFLLGVLTTDVLVHTWDLSRAVGVEVRLDPRLCQVGWERATLHADRLRSSGWFGPPVTVPDDAGVQDRLLGIFGRDPAWSPPEDVIDGVGNDRTVSLRRSFPPPSAR